MLSAMESVAFQLFHETGWEVKKLRNHFHSTLELFLETTGILRYVTYVYLDAAPHVADSSTLQGLGLGHTPQEMGYKMESGT